MEGVPAALSHKGKTGKVFSLKSQKNGKTKRWNLGRETGTFRSTETTLGWEQAFPAETKGTYVIPKGEEGGTENPGVGGEKTNCKPIPGRKGNAKISHDLGGTFPKKGGFGPVLGKEQWGRALLQTAAGGVGGLLSKRKPPG